MNPDFILIPYQVVSDDRLHGLDRVVYGVVYWFSQMSSSRCYASNGKIAEVCGAGAKPKSVGDALGRLEEFGYVKRVMLNDKVREEIVPLITYRTSNNVPSTDGRGSVYRRKEVPSVDGTIKNSNKEKNTDKTSAGASGAEVSEIIKLFEPVNAEAPKWYRVPPQRKAVSDLIETYGIDQVRKVVQALPGLIVQPYCPKVTSPYELRRDYAKLMAWGAQQQGKQRETFRPIISSSKQQ